MQATTDSTAPAPIAMEGTYNGLPVGFTDAGYAYLGDGDAPVSLIEFKRHRDQGRGLT